MISSWPIEKLGDHIKQSTLKNKLSKDIDVYFVTNSMGFTKSTEYFKKEVFSKKTTLYKIVNHRSFAYNPSRINVGSIDYLKKINRVLVSPLYIVFNVDNEIDHEYLLRYLKDECGLTQIRHNTQGAVRDSLKYKGLENIEIPLPPIDDQIRITTLLNKVESLIAKRKKSIADLDELLKSTFLEMFGDPVRNEMGWEFSTVAEFCKTVIDCPHKTPIYSDDNTKLYCVRSSDIVNGYLELSETKQVDVGVFEDRILRHLPQRDDILYCREGGRLGNAARIISNDKICLGQRIMLFDVNDKHRSHFVWALLESFSFKKKVNSLIGGGGAPRINIKDIKNIKTIKPPLDIQNKFATIVQKVESIKDRYQKSLNDLENLYGTLSQKVFKGELDLSRIPLKKEAEPPQEMIEPQIQETVKEPQ